MKQFEDLIEQLLGQMQDHARLAMEYGNDKLYHTITEDYMNSAVAYDKIFKDMGDAWDIEQLEQDEIDATEFLDVET